LQAALAEQKNLQGTRFTAIIGGSFGV